MTWPCWISVNAPAICSSRVTIGHIVLISAQVNTVRGIPLLEAVTFGASQKFSALHRR